MGHYHTMRSREDLGAFVPLHKYHPCRQSTLFAQPCHCAAKHAMEEGSPTATCCKWQVGDGLVPRIANQRNANQCQRHVMQWEHHDYASYVRHRKKKFFLLDHLFSYPPPPLKGKVPSEKKIPLGIKNFFPPPLPPTLPPHLSFVGTYCMSLNRPCVVLVADAKMLKLSNFWPWQRLMVVSMKS